MNNYLRDRRMDRAVRFLLNARMALDAAIEKEPQPFVRGMLKALALEIRRAAQHARDLNRCLSYEIERPLLKREEGDETQAEIDELCRATTLAMEMAEKPIHQSRPSE